jgi:hypothetical protein
MPVRCVILWILLSGISVSVAMPCHAREASKLFDVKVPQAVVSSSSVPNLASGPAPAAEQAKPGKAEPKKTWLRRLFEGMVTSAAKFNTEKQDDGRPQPVPGK